jgi:hypothetical protein
MMAGENITYMNVDENCDHIEIRKILNVSNT